MGPLPLALGRPLAAPPLRGLGPSRSSSGVQGAWRGVGQVGPGEQGCVALLLGAGEGGQEAEVWGRNTGQGRGHPCACCSLANPPHGSWSQVSPPLGRRPGRELGTPFPHPTPTTPQGVSGWRPADPLTPLTPPSLAP